MFSALACATVLLATPQSDVLLVKRPSAPESFSVYLQGKKLGYMVSSFSRGKNTVTNRTEMRVRAKVGDKVVERSIIEERTYEDRPEGRLMRFEFDARGDGGDQRLVGTREGAKFKVARTGKGQPAQEFRIPAPEERVEDADANRVAILRGKVHTGKVVDLTDLQTYRVVTTPGPVESRVIAGVTMKLRKVRSINDKEKVEFESFYDEKGRLIEFRFGPTMLGIAEPLHKAKELTEVEVFSLTRIVLNAPIPQEARSVPGSITYLIRGLPERFRVTTARQSFRQLSDGRTELTVTARLPKSRAVPPLSDPEGGTNLKSTLAIEKDAPQIQALARQFAKPGADAWSIAVEANRWVAKHIRNAYGVSSDRATEVLRTMQGDCTEHSLLLVSLLRALGIPARRIDGIVYVQNEDGVPAFYWHEWVEAYVGEWIQLDPTFDQDVADPAHIAFGAEASAEIVPLMGSLAIEVVPATR